MAMLDAFFSKGFKGARCKTLLKLTIPRIKLLRNRREIQLKQMRRDIAKLLENGQEATARIRVEHIIREENMMAAQEIIELFCELIAVRLPIIETQRECPLDLKEAISSICFAAPRCSDLPELQQVQMMFAAKYGKEFVAAAAELMPDSGVNRQIIELLSIRAPSVESKLKLLKEIAEEHEVDWDPAASETEFLKPHEDLLNGPSHIISGSTLPLPKERHDDYVSSSDGHTEEHHEETNSDAGFDSLDLPEVPKASVRATSEGPSTPDISHLHAENSLLKHTDSELSESANTKESEQIQFIPFTFPPHFSASSPLEHGDTAPVPHHDPSSKPFVASPPPPPPFMLTSEQSDPTLVHHEPSLSTPAIPPPSPFSLSSKQSDPTPFHGRNEDNVDLQDVLAAAQAAAESADRAAAAARAAASLAQVRIAELINKKNENRQKSSPAANSDAQTQEYVGGLPTFDQRNSFGYTDRVPQYQPVQNLGSPTLSSENVAKMGDGSLDAQDIFHQPQRSVSLEDDPYFSYPNLFSRQDSGLKPGARSDDP